MKGVYMKKKKTLIFATIIAVIVSTGVITSAFLLSQNYIKTNSTTQNEISKTDAEKFAEEYPSASSDNVFVYRDIDEIIKIMKNGTGVVYLGFPDCQWCQAYVKYLDEVAQETGLETIYYFNISEDRKNNTEKYQEIVAILGDNLQYDEEGNLRVYVPNISFHINGEIIGNDYESSKNTLGYDSPEDYWTSERIDNLKTTLKGYSKKIVDSIKNCEETCDV